jgi:hypothetical protein
MQRARMAQIRRDYDKDGSDHGPRRDPPPIRFGAALFCNVSRVEISRDVGLAESGLRPTAKTCAQPLILLAPGFWLLSSAIGYWLFAIPSPRPYFSLRYSIRYFALVGSPVARAMRSLGK